MDVSAVIERSGEGPRVRVKLRNPGDQLAFQVHLGIRHQGEDAKILPLLWQDNYIELMPGESREITVRFLSQDELGSASELAVDGWNVEPSTVSLGPLRSE
jgi:exo-1,4-beta-D-glucosaminidase